LPLKASANLSAVLVRKCSKKSSASVKLYINTGFRPKLPRQKRIEPAGTSAKSEKIVLCISLTLRREHTSRGMRSLASDDSAFDDRNVPNPAFIQRAGYRQADHARADYQNIGCSAVTHAV